MVVLVRQHRVGLGVEAAAVEAGGDHHGRLRPGALRHHNHHSRPINSEIRQARYSS